jgi:hypothetical protein
MVLIRKGAIMKPLPTVEYLRECFTLDENTGTLTWKVRPSSHFSEGKYSPERKSSLWNAKFAGKTAGCRTSIGYLSVCIGRRSFWHHRIIVAMVCGNWPPKGSVTDHINGAKDDNRAVNLRIVTGSMNNHNRNILDRRNKSGVTGVSWCNRESKWRAYGVNPCTGKSNSLGYFKDIADAISARREYVEKNYKGHVRHLNQMAAA